jgi:hypothetical protein
MTTTHAITARTATAVADQINADFAAGRITTAGGDKLASRYGQPVARAWQNGTVSVTVKARSKRGFNDVYVKVGHSLRVA